MAELAVLAPHGPPTPKKRANWVPYALLAPGLLWLVVFFVLPMITLGSQSLQEGSVEAGYTFTGNVSIYADALQKYWPQLLRSIGYAATATVAALVLAYPLAYYIAQKAGRWKNVMLVLVVAPFFTSFLIRTLAWRTILSDTGPVTHIFQVLHITDLLQFLHLTDNDTLLSSKFAVMAGLTYNFLPFMILPLYAALDRLDPRLVEAAGDLYASPWQGFRHVTWPLSLPGVVAGTLLTFIPAAGDYINASRDFLGGADTQMIGNVIEANFLVLLNYPAAAALSIILMTVILVIVGVYVKRSGTEELL